ncbi:Oxoglutarate and iron-dependent oxygenase degradation C-term-domain-containing protein [Xylaria sp. CBS 124048]|nr:Oxoglutarate and iron-dependent oxygenase degradation C-term-domain-containing protein [Xylaria sp. CBS 124048]
MIMAKTKRKAEEPHVVDQNSNKKAKFALSSEDAQKRFRKGLFDTKVLDQYKREYAESSPYKHAVIPELIDDELLRAVRTEIKDNVSFTPKETDIYKIHQSGDLANLDGLSDDALAKLPSLLALRDALYSQSFRDYVADVTGSGPLSGRKTDMAINVYTPGCYLLCHDDVISSRKVSYILYLTDPDTPWKPEWGGALRLFPVQTLPGEDGQVARMPTPDVSKVIPPAWNQLSFFAVQPGESFHDVEEVYHAESEEQLALEGGRVRMAISGWFHIPQVGEAGYVEGAEELNAKNSSLMQLQGNPDQYDEPPPRSVPTRVKTAGEDEEDEDFDEADLSFLLRFLAPTYLTPGTMEQVADNFSKDSSIALPNLLGNRFAARLRKYLMAQEKTDKPLPDDTTTLEKETPWRVAKPPHKHRYLYIQSSSTPTTLNKKEKGAIHAKNMYNEPKESELDSSPVQELLDDFLPSSQFRRWLEIATGCTIESHDIIARRFRRGKDYTLATGHEGKPRLELNLSITPTKGWGAGNDSDDDEVDTSAAGRKARIEKRKNKAKLKKQKEKEEGEVGGHEVYMAGDESDDDEDAAVYKSSSGDNNDGNDNILFFQPAAWNRLSLVLRDSGALRFVKYVSRKAKGDRWDLFGTYEIEEEYYEDSDDEEEDEEGVSEVDVSTNDTEGDFEDSSATEDSDSD